MAKNDWDVDAASATYNVDGWGSGYFSVNSAGNVVAKPLKDAGGSIDLLEVVNEARERGLGFPLVIRFQDLLRHRVETINRAFHAAIQEFGYRNQYRGVFPIKVNQLREVVEEIVDAGAPFHFGLEAGSKPELIAALAMHKDPESLIICNGYKDRAFIRTALLGRKLGKKVIIVVEKTRGTGANAADREGNGRRAQIGMRVRLHSKGAGKWATSGGENAKFGLSTADLVAASELLKARGARALPQARAFPRRLAGARHRHDQARGARSGALLREALEAGPRARLPRCRRRPRRRLRRLAHQLRQLDELLAPGVRATTSSITSWTSATPRGVAHPAIVSESGRAIVAHHSVLVVEAFGSIEKDAQTPKDRGAARTIRSSLRDILEVQRQLQAQNRLETLHDAQQIKEEAQQMFELGLLELESEGEDRDALLGDRASRSSHLHRGLKYRAGGSEGAGDVARRPILCNFSVFQSLLDHWALGQLFPIMPIHRLNDCAGRQGTLVDITCDSDGKVSKFIDLQDVNDTLPLHKIMPGRAVLPRLLPHRRLPGHHGRPAQPLRPRERGACLPR